MAKTNGTIPEQRSALERQLETLQKLRRTATLQGLPQYECESP